MITVCTKRWEEKHGKKPRGRGYWLFEGQGEAVGNRKPPGIRSYSHGTDIEWPEAKENAINGARLWFGSTANVTLELQP